MWRMNRSLFSLFVFISVINLCSKVVAFIPPSRHHVLLQSIQHQNNPTYYNGYQKYLSCLYAQTDTILFDEIQTKDIHDLPVYNILDNIRQSLELKKNLLLEASPGAGKSAYM